MFGIGLFVVVVIIVFLWAPWNDDRAYQASEDRKIRARGTIQQRREERLKNDPEYQSLIAKNASASESETTSR